MADTNTILFYVYEGETYIGTQVAGTTRTVANPVKITFTYENTTTTSAKLSWLLSPVFPTVLMKAKTTENNPTITYPEGGFLQINAGAAALAEGDVIDSIITAYKSVTA